MNQVDLKDRISSNGQDSIDSIQTVNCRVDSVGSLPAPLAQTNRETNNQDLRTYRLYVPIYNRSTDVYQNGCHQLVMASYVL